MLCHQLRILRWRARGSESAWLRHGASGGACAGLAPPAWALAPLKRCQRLPCLHARRDVACCAADLVGQLDHIAGAPAVFMVVMVLVACAHVCGWGGGLSKARETPAALWGCHRRHGGHRRPTQPCAHVQAWRPAHAATHPARQTCTCVAPGGWEWVAARGRLPPPTHPGLHLPGLQPRSPPTRPPRCLPAPPPLSKTTMARPHPHRPHTKPCTRACDLPCPGLSKRDP